MSCCAALRPDIDVLNAMVKSLLLNQKNSLTSLTSTERPLAKFNVT